MARVKAERGRFITPEEERALRLKLRSAYRTVVPFYDYTYSAPKSVSVLWASLLAASAEAEAEGREADAERFAEQAAQVRGAVKRANDRMIAVAERELAYVRTGHHSKTSGEWRDAEGFIVASFEQHDSRDGRCSSTCTTRSPTGRSGADGADDLWRALHGHPLFRNKLRMGTLADRFLAQELELIGLLSVLRADGKALEVGGISDEAVDEFCTRSKELRDQGAGARGGVRRDHGHAPGKRARWAIRQRAATGDAGLQGSQPASGRRAGGRVGAQSGAERDRRAGRAPRSSRGLLGGARAEQGAERRGAGADHPQGRRRGRRLSMPRGTGAQLMFELGQVLPPLPADVDPEEYLNGLADEALSGRAEGVNVLQVAPAPDVIDVTRLGLRQGRDVASTGRRARSGSAPPSTATMSSTWSTWRCCRCRSGSARRPRPRRWRARTWTTPSGRRASAC